MRNIVYSFNINNHKFEPKYYLNFGQYNLPDKIIEKYNPNGKNKVSSKKGYRDFMINYLPKSPYVNKISKLYESDNFIYFTYNYSKMCHAIYSKKTKNTITGSKVINDIDGGIAFNPPIGILGLNNNLLIGYLETNILLNKTKNIKVPGKKLQNLIDSSTSYDNPIIYYLKLKSF